MSLLNGLHYVGLGAITLNWCVNKKQDLSYRKFAGIKDCETLLLVIGIGNLPETMKVPKSERREVSEIITYI